MNYKEFEKYIMTLKECSDKLDAVTNILDCDFFWDLTSPLFDATVDLLESHFKDEDGWIYYWLFDLDFGNAYKPGMVLQDNKTTPLKTIEDLYELIKEK